MDMYVYARDGTVEAAARADLAESHLLQIVVWDISQHFKIDLVPEKKEKKKEFNAFRQLSCRLVPFFFYTPGNAPR